MQWDGESRITVRASQQLVRPTAHAKGIRADVVDMSRIRFPFSALVVVQAAHSVEEWVGHLWESFPPATFVTGVISADPAVGFLIINGTLVAFGVWCAVWPVRRGWRSAASLAWFWVVLETINGIGHPAWSLRQGGYTPGVLTAPFLLVVAVYLAHQLRSGARRRAQPA